MVSGQFSITTEKIGNHGCTAWIMNSQAF